MGQVAVPSIKDIILTAVDRLQARNAGAGNVGNHVILLGANAGNNSTLTDTIALGFNNLSASPADANGNGSTVIGSQAGTLLTNFTTAIPGPVTILGYKAAKLATTIPASVIIGAQALENLDNTGGGASRALTIIGFQALQNAKDIGGVAIDGSVIIGYRASRGIAVGKVSIIQSVIIGNNANANYATGSGGSLASAVIIGDSSCLAMTNTNRNVVIGQGTGTSASGPNCDDNTIIGQGSDFASPTGAVVIGRAISIAGANQTGVVIIGANAGNNNNTTFGNRSIIIGYRACQNVPALGADKFIVDTFDTITRRSMFFGDLNAGNLLIGNASDAQRAIVFAPNGSSNILQLINGSKSLTNPTNSGYFYVVAGVLHWIDPAGTDSTLSLGATGQLAQSVNAAYTNNAAAAAGTLLNAPVAGNPTKWIPINDNGTIRNIPVW